MLWPVRIDDAVDRYIFHCDLCCEQTWSPPPLERGGYCSCQMGKFKWMDIPEYMRDQPKYLFRNVVWCTQCRGYVGDVKRTRWRNNQWEYVCAECVAQNKLLKECSKAIRNLKRLLHT